jgi:hypothetical protein
MDGTSISFDSHSLQTSSIIPQGIDHFSGPTKKMSMYGIAHANYSAIPFLNYPSKTIVVSGRLDADSITGLDALIDTFKSYFTGKDKNLDIGYNGSTRRYICTPESPQIDRPGGLAWANFSVTFDCTYPFGRDTSTSSLLSASSRTGAIYNDTITVSGTAPFQYPLITITYTSITGGSNVSVVVGNNANGQTLTITRTWATNDVLVIDVLNKTATVNSSLVDFTGAFPEFPPGTQSMSYSDGFTARSFDISITYYPMWL